MVVILVVSGEARVSQHLRSVLGSQGWWVMTAADREAALRAAADHQPALVVVDCEIEGAFELVRVFGARNGGPGVLLLEPPEEADAAFHAFEVGADQILSKPPRAKELLEAAERVMSLPHQSAGSTAAGMGDKLSAADIFGEVLLELDATTPERDPDHAAASVGPELAGEMPTGSDHGVEADLERAEGQEEFSVESGTQAPGLDERGSAAETTDASETAEEDGWELEEEKELEEEEEKVEEEIEPGADEEEETQEQEENEETDEREGEPEEELSAGGAEAGPAMEMPAEKEPVEDESVPDEAFTEHLVEPDFETSEAGTAGDHDAAESEFEASEGAPVLEEEVEKRDVGSEDAEPVEEEEPAGSPSLEVASQGDGEESGMGVGPDVAASTLDPRSFADEVNEIERMISGLVPMEEAAEPEASVELGTGSDPGAGKTEDFQAEISEPFELTEFEDTAELLEPVEPAEEIELIEPGEPAQPTVPLAPFPEAPREGEEGRFGQYRLDERIAVGGMAEVWRASMLGMEGFRKTVAIKKILPHLAENTEFVAMFVEEAKLAAQLSHENLVEIYDLGKIGEGLFIAM
jgi:CheY-like chemotaxis protein